MARINEILRQLRQERGMTQEDVAQEVGLTRQAVSSYESGRTQPGLDMLQRLADLYQVELTDIIYGRTSRLRPAIKITAIASAAVLLVLELAESLLLWTANRFFPIGEAFTSVSPNATAQAFWTHTQLGAARTMVGSVYALLFPLCCIALFVLSLCLRQPLRVKTKLLCVLSFAAASILIALPWALTDPVFSAANYFFAPMICLAQLLFFLVLSLVIDGIRRRRRKRAA